MAGPVLELFAKLGMDSSEYDRKLKDSSDDAKSFASSFASGMKKAAAVGVAAFTAMAGAVAKFGADAVASYGQYEQLVGGVQKLYGNAGMSLEKYAEVNGTTTDKVEKEWKKLEKAQNEVLKNAQEAYLTSGKSMNEYMETATGFSAALIKSLNGDTQKAAKITDIAMQAMSDNVNTFGSDAEAVQNAFMGLSRKNYMMIDNLKLGYSGTAQGMMELINDSGVLGKQLTKTSELADVGFDKMIMAIQKVQEQQGIAGTTTREALHTIEGSATATRKAWENVVIAIGKGEGLENALDGMMTALFGQGGEDPGGLVNNITPRIQTVMEGIANFVAKGGPIISEKLPELINSIFPSLFKATTSLISSLASSLPSVISGMATTLAPELQNVFSTLYDYMMENLPLLVQGGADMMKSIGDGLKEKIPEFLENALPMLLEFSEMLRENASIMIESGIELILKIVDGLIEGLPSLIEYVPQIITNVANIINDNMPKIFEMGILIISKLITGIVNNVPNLLANFGEIVSAVISVITAVNWLDLGATVLKSIINGVKSLATSLPNTMKSIAEDGWKAIKNIDWKGIGSAIINGIVSGIRAFGSMIKNTLTGLVDDAWKGVKKFLGISSPSKLFRNTVGKFIPLGIAEGVDDEADSVYDAMEELSEGTQDAYDPVFDDIFSETIDRRTDDKGDAILNALTDLKNAILGMSVVLDTGATVGGLAPAMDSTLGSFSVYKGRGN